MSVHSNILEEILAAKRLEVAASAAAVPLAELQALAKEARSVRSFSGALNRRWPGIIAEIKRRSPSKGEFRPGMDVLQMASDYEQGGAAALSVLTDEQYFGMRREELSLISERVNLPVLRKEFIVEPYQIYEARALGADAVLLIASALSISELAELNNLTAALGMEALIEVHSEAELDTVLEIDARLIGVNSRDLRTFKTDLSLVERIAEIVREEAPDVALVAESGMSTPAQLRNLRPLGVQGFLIGEALLTSEHPEEKLRQLLAAGESQGAQS